jgi:diketogulonate reductase-like aldo/keto reductase
MGLEYVDLFLAHFPAAIKPLPGLKDAANFIGATPLHQRCAEDERGHYVPDLEHCPRAVASLNGSREGGSFVPTWEAMKELVYMGKCRAIGVSNFEREHLEEILPHASHSDVPISCNQIEAHPWYPNTALVEFLHDNGILPTIYSPFAPKTFAVNNGVVEACEFAPDGVTLLREPVVNAVAHKNGMDAGQVLQSWAVQRGTVPLAKSRSKSRIASNLAIRGLSDEDELLLNSLEKYGLSGKCIDVNLLFPGVRMR